MVDEESLEAYCSIVCGQNKVLGRVNRIALKPWSDSNVILVIGRTARRQTSEDRGGKPPAYLRRGKIYEQIILPNAHSYKNETCILCS